MCGPHYFVVSTGGLGSRLAELRLGRGLSVQRLAEITGLERSTIAGIEREVVAPSAEHLERLAAALGAFLLDASPAPAVAGPGGSDDPAATLTCLRGRLKVSLDEHAYFLGAGDSIRCPRAVACRVESLADERAECVWTTAPEPEESVR